MRPMATWVMPPRKRTVSIINAGLEAFCRINGFDNLDSQRLQVCVEGVFIYCVNNIREFNSSADLSVKLFWEEQNLKVVIQHDGPKGEWDDSLGNENFIIRRTSFAALGLFIAKELLHELNYENLFNIVTSQTTNRYELVYRLGDKPDEGITGDKKDTNAKELLDYLNSNV